VPGPAVRLGLPTLFSASSSSPDRVGNPSTATGRDPGTVSAGVETVVAAGPDSTGGEEATARAAADPEQLHALVMEHSDAIFRLALSVVRDRSLAEDVAQETLVKAWLALPSFRGESSVRSWVLRITHNTAVSTLRRHRAVVLDPHDMPEQESRVERSVESRVQSNVVMDQFVAALDQLDELSRSIVVLRELEGLAYDEIADVLNVPMPTVKTRLLRARRRLGSALRDWE
jgi:RNA polymerase sigma-70 factor (ECF subfamily)